MIGPTCAGKSTYIEKLRKEAATDGQELEVHFGFEVRRGKEVPTGPNDVVHLNLLRGGDRTDDQIHQVAPGARADLVQLLAAAERVVVIAAPRSVLLARAGKREKLEPDHEKYANTNYDGARWEAMLKTVHLAQMYEQIALTLDGSGKPVEYLCSNHDEVVPVSRWQFPLLATERAEKLCADGHPAPDLDLGSRTYQADYREGASGSMRSLTLQRALRMPLAGKRVLDIGCAEGAAALSAARMGADVTGLEPKPARFRKARKISKALGTPIELHNMILDGYDEPGRSFDVVLALNVIHHVNDPFAFLDRAAHLTRSHLVLEYPGLGDRKFGATVPGKDVPGDELPLIAVSLPAEQDQTYVYTPASFERYLVEILGVFGKHEIIESPISDRWISVFSKKQRKSGLDSALARESRLRRQLAEREQETRRLQRRVDELESSTSWKVTAPLRKVTGKLR
ncbi:MAG: methyltransferase domain-containing protein [Nocardioides sp.]